MTEGVEIQHPAGALIEANPAARRLIGAGLADLRDVAVVREDGTAGHPASFPVLGRSERGSPHGRVIGMHDPVRGRRWLTSSSQPLHRERARGPVGGGVHLHRRHRPS